MNNHPISSPISSSISRRRFIAIHAAAATAVTGGGLTVIANAPNPAGQSILGKFFGEGVSPLKLFLGALIPTLITICAMKLLPDSEAHRQLNEGKAPATDVHAD